MKKIALFSLGGTISAKGINYLDLKDYQSGLLTGEDLLLKLPNLQQIADIDVVQIDNVSSTQLTSIHWIKLKEQIEEYLNHKDYDGIVVTQGTSTLEETAYFIHLTVHSDKPIVFVGAQRPFDSISSDAPLNLVHAFLVATSDEAKGNGVLVVSNGEIHSARDVTKTNTYKLETFQSSIFGCLGIIDVDFSVQFYRAPIRKHTFSSVFSNKNINDLPNVEIIYSYAGATGEQLKFIQNNNSYKGVVIAGQGAGRFTKLEEEVINHLVNYGIVIVRSSRGGHGRVVPIEAYNQLNLISGDNLTPQKARILLMLALTLTKNTDEIQQLFNQY